MWAFEEKILLLLKTIPVENDELSKGLTDLLDKWKEECGWWAPEVVEYHTNPYWKKAAEILESYAQATNIDNWQNQCLKIFNTPIEDLHANYMDFN